MSALNNPQVRPGFNGQGTLDLNDLNGLPPLPFKDATFSHFDFTDLETVDIDTENFCNVGIREDFDFDDRIQRYQVSFARHGFKMTEWPPSRDTNGDWLEGRGRASGAKLNGERWMPTAVYSRSDTSLKNTVTNGLIGNMDRLPAFSATFPDIVSAGVHLINSNEILPTVEDIDHWLYHEIEIERIFNNQNGLITRLRDTIIDRATRNDSLILRRTTGEWHRWIKKNLGYSRSEYVLVNCADNDTYAERLWCRHILLAVQEARDPVNIIYYTSAYSPSESRKGLKKSMASLENLYMASFDLVNSQLKASGVSLSPATTRPYNVLGAVPQIVQTHNTQGHNLVTVSKY